MRQLAAVAALFALVGCGRYSEFRLPVPDGTSSELRFSWEVEKDPVMRRGAGWESVDVLNPSVFRQGESYVNLYSGFDGKTWRTGVAFSKDGKQWDRHSMILAPSVPWEGSYIAGNGSGLFDRGKTHYWYQAGAPIPSIGLATLGGADAWEKLPAPVLEPGPTGSWDERGVADPYVIRSGETLYMYYLGQDRARRQRLGVARSVDGIKWTKLGGNPILELGAQDAFDEVGLGEPAVWTSHGKWWMLYTGRDRAEMRRIGLASSNDGVQWSRVAGFPILAGSEPWNSKVVCDPSVEPFAEGVRVWFGGGDVAHPAENIHGEIGFAVLRMIPRESPNR